MTFIRRSITALLVLAAVITASAFAQATTAKPKAKGGDPIVQDRPLSAWIADLGALAPYTRVSAAYAVGSAGPAGKRRSAGAHREPEQREWPGALLEHAGAG